MRSQLQFTNSGLWKQIHACTCPVTLWKSWWRQALLWAWRSFWVTTFFYWLLDENDHWKITHTRCWSNTLLTEPHGKGWFLYSYQRLPKKANETDRLALWSKSWRLNDAEAFTVLPQIPVRYKNCWLLTWCKPIFYAILKRNEAQSAHAWVKVVNSWNTEGWGPGAAEVSGGKGGNAPFATEQL